MSRSRRMLRVVAAAAAAVLLSAHVGSPDVFFAGRAGPYDLRVTIAPPQVVPGIARVIVRAGAGVRGVAIRPVYWRAGTRGAPSPDAMRRLDGGAGGGTFEGSLWLMARGAYSVDVIVDGASGPAQVLVPVASVATGRLALSPGLGALLAVLGMVLAAGLVTIVYKGAGESLVDAGAPLDGVRLRRARRVAALSVPILALAVLGGARWWGAVDRDYERRMYRPSTPALSLNGRTLTLRATDTVWTPTGRPLRYLPDHGKPMHLFLVRTDDARAFAHLHPRALDTSAVPPFETRVPDLPAGAYHVFADVVDETGFDRTLVGRIALPGSRSAGATPLDPDDAWFVGDASRDSVAALADGSSMRLDLAPGGLPQAGREETLRLTVLDPAGKPAMLEPYLGMRAHAVIARIDGGVYVHLHPMGTVTVAAQQAFEARDRGDTASDGRLRLAFAHAMAEPSAAPIAFPYAFPRGGSYRLFVQVKRHGRVLTGAFALAVAEATRMN